MSTKTHSQTEILIILTRGISEVKCQRKPVFAVGPCETVDLPARDAS